MPDVAESTTINVPCSHCAHVSTLTVRWLRSNNHFVCPDCGGTTNLNSDNLIAEIEIADTALAEAKAAMSGATPPDELK